MFPVCRSGLYGSLFPLVRAGPGIATAAPPSPLLRHASRTSVRHSSTELKRVLREVIPEKRNLLRRLKKEYGDKRIGEITVNSLLGGMRGLKSMLWDGSQVDPITGIRFHGKTIVECQALLPKADEGGEMLPEAMFWFLLSGKVPTTNEIRAFSVELADKGTLPEYVSTLLDCLPPTMHPMTQISIGVAALNHDSEFAYRYQQGLSKEDYWEPTFDDAINLMAKLPAIAAKIYQNVYRGGGPVPGYISRNADWALNFSNLLRVSTDPDFVDFLRLYLALHADHEGGNVSAHATHLVGSALSDPYLSYSAGLQGLAGPLHGLAAQEVLRFILSMKDAIPSDYSPQHIEAFLWDTIKSGRVIPGYGHAALRKPDPRFEALMTYARGRPAISQHDPVFRLVLETSEIAPRVLTAHGKTSCPFPNVDAASGVLMHHFGLTQTMFYTVAFGVSRSIGPLAQLIWDRALGLPIERPRSMCLQSVIASCQDGQ
ncbi:citrate synthase-like protein [Lipomyces tetrasporus]|uniref:Citrate synthase n=1 Tax=Lipomyces tetrasporus TaxID=54092 RepID=A0AAD7QVY6_9ASCO|nr:citrate synthase-like protein [Lipomyces tetrasporus]KAJ8102485.1 citrate synthase-like protein [Lipomyces tetrasporus]